MSLIASCRPRAFTLADEGVYKFVIPRQGTVRPRDDETMYLGFNSWVAFTSATHEEATVAGEFLLLEDELNPVLTSLFGDRLQVTGLAQSSIFDSMGLGGTPWTSQAWESFINLPLRSAGVLTP
jgi:hypothetical protein